MSEHIPSLACEWNDPMHSENLAQQFLGHRCDEDILCPDDLIRPCIREAGHDGWHDGGVR